MLTFNYLRSCWHHNHLKWLELVLQTRLVPKFIDTSSPHFGQHSRTRTSCCQIHGCPKIHFLCDHTVFGERQFVSLCIQKSVSRPVKTIFCILSWSSVSEKIHLPLKILFFFFFCWINDILLLFLQFAGVSQRLFRFHISVLVFFLMIWFLRTCDLWSFLEPYDAGLMSHFMSKKL